MMRIFRIFSVIIIAGALFSCDHIEAVSLSREDLFTLSLGTMEDQFGYFFTDGLQRLAKSGIHYDDGLFYITNGQARKVMAFSQLGELTLLLYNPAFNPQPVMLKPAEQKQNEYDIISRRAVKTPFTDIGAFAVDSQKNLYIEDDLERSLRDETAAGGAMYRKVIRRYNRRGDLIDVIGRTGRDGLPFPAIEYLSLTDADELVVLCRTSQGMTAYWFDHQSRPLFEVEFDLRRLPLPPGVDLIPTLGKIVPDYQERNLHVFITYYANVKDESTRLVSRIVHAESRIYTFNLERAAYDPQPVVVPAESGQSADPLFSQDKQKTPLPYSLLGVSDRGQYYLMKMKNKTTYELLVLDAAGRAVKKIRLFVDDTDLVSADFRIAKNGMLYALIAENTCARIVRWRSDQAVSGGL